MKRPRPLQSSPGWQLLLLLPLFLLASVSESRTLKACGHPFYPPVSWSSEDRLQGLAPTVTRELFGELGYQVEFSADSNWKRCLLEVKQGKADIVVAAYRIASREQYLSYSNEHIIADTVTLFVNRHKPLKFQQLEDLQDKTVGLLLGDSFGDEFDRFVNLNSHIEYVSQGRQNFEKLALGRIDYMPLGQLSGYLQSRKFAFGEQIISLPQVITTEYYYLAVGRHSDLQQHLPFINRRLREMRRDGTLNRWTEQFSQQYLNSP